MRNYSHLKFVNTMTTEDSCKKIGNVIFTSLVDESKIAFNVQPTLIATAFEMSKLQIVKITLSQLFYRFQNQHHLNFFP